MLSYCLKWRKNTERKNQKAARTKNGRILLLFFQNVPCAVASGLLSGLGIKACLSKIPLVGLLLF